MKSTSNTSIKIRKTFETGRSVGGFAAAFFFLNGLMNVSYPLPADDLVPTYFNRSFNLYLGSQFLPDLIFLLYTTLPLWQLLLWSLLSVGTVALVTWGIWRALMTVANFFTRQKKRRIFAVAAVALGIVVYSLNPWQTGGGIFAPGIFHRIAAEIDFMEHLSAGTERHLAAFEEAIQKGAQYQKPLDKLNGSDVYVFFIESYGHTIFADPRHAPLIVPYLRDARRKLSDRGYLIASNFLGSPTYGGASWLAHGSLASGVPITNQLRYDLKVLVEFLAKMLDHDALIIILGDHQPNLKITGNDQPWSVPVHVISRNPDFIKPFIQSGYTPGLIPSQPLPHAGIESILWNLLEKFS